MVEFLYFMVGAFVGAIVLVATLCVVAMNSVSKNKKGDNQQCTNQEQK